MRGKRTIICCCGANLWVHIIGWIQTIGFLLLTAVLFFVIEDLPDDDYTHHDPYAKRVYDILIASVVILFTGVLFGGFLLVGAFTKQTSLISAWVVYTMMLLLFDIICTARVIILAVEAPWLSIILAVLAVTTLLMMHGFSLYVVNIFVSEMFIYSSEPCRLI